jgi:hypothetical protein
MSTSSADPESPSSGAAVVYDPDRTHGPSSRSRDDVTVLQVPSFLSADAAWHPADDDGPARATSTLETEVKRLQSALDTAAQNHRVRRAGRRQHAATGMAVASVMIAAAAGAYVFVNWPPADEWEAAELSPGASPLLPGTATGGEAGLQALPQPALPTMQAAQPENRPAEKPMEVAALDLPPDMPARPATTALGSAPVRPKPPETTTPETKQPETAAPGPEYPERAVIMAGVMAVAPSGPAPLPATPPPLLPPALAPPPSAAPALVPPSLVPPSLVPPSLVPPSLVPAALPEPPAAASSPFGTHESFAMAPREPAPSVRYEPLPDLFAVKHTQPQTGRLLPGPSFRTSFQFADSSTRYLTSAELQRLSADRLRLARNEIFARKGRFFKDEALRAYFSQFAWYQPRAWDVPLSPVEVANVGLIQSVADAAAPRTRSVGEPVPAETEPETRVADPRRQYLTPADLHSFSTDQLALVRNEIFARKGRYFKDPALRAYFEQFPWYQPYSWDVPLTPVERANVDTIQSVEQARTGHLPPT